MPQKSVLTTITPLPLSVSRESAIAFVHDHARMITLNPLVIRHSVTQAPSNATDEELSRCVWYAITDKISYIPGLKAKSEVTYKAAFYDLPDGLQTHVFAPGGVDIRGHWTIGGNLPGEPREPLELGSTLPRDRLYLREHTVLRCNMFFTKFIKKNLKKSHAVVVQSLFGHAAADEARAASIEVAKQEHQHQRSVSLTESVEGPSSFDQQPCTCVGGVHLRSCRHYPALVSFAQPAPGSSHESTTSTQTLHHDNFEQSSSPNHRRQSLDRAELEGASYWPANSRDDLDNRELPAEMHGGRRYSETDI